MRQKKGTITLELGFPSDGAQELGAGAVSLWGSVRVPCTEGNAAVLGKRADGTWVSDLVREQLCKPWEAMTMLQAVENHELYSKMLGPLIGILIEDVKHRTLRIVDEALGWDLTVELRLGGGCGGWGDQSVRLKLSGKECSGPTKCEFAVQQKEWVEDMDWLKLDAMGIHCAGDLQRFALERIVAGTPDGVVDKSNGMRCVWPIIVVDPGRDLESRGINPKAPPTMIELLHLRQYAKSAIYNTFNMARKNRRPGEQTAPPQELMNKSLNEFLGVHSWKEATQPNFSLTDKILFDFMAVLGPAMEFGAAEMAWWADYTTTIFGGCALDAVKQDAAMVMRINVAAAASFWLVKDMCAARLMTQDEMYDCYMRNTLIFLPHLHGHGLNTEKGILRYPLSDAHTQDEEATMAKKRKVLKDFTAKGGFKPKGHEEEGATEAMLRELPLRAGAEAVVTINHVTGRGENSSRATLRAGTISQWLARPRCPLNFDTVIPCALLGAGTTGGECLPEFLRRRGYKRGVHYHHVQDVGVVFHVSSPLGAQEDEREFAPAAEFHLPQEMLQYEMSMQCAWHERHELVLSSKKAGWQCTTTERRTIVGNTDADAADSEVEEKITHRTAAQMKAELTVPQMKAQCEALYDRGLGLQPPTDLCKGRAGGTGANGALKAADWAAELLRLSEHATVGAALVRVRYMGSAAELRCAHPQWPGTLRYPHFTMQNGRRIVRHDVAAQRAAAAREEAARVEAATRQDEAACAECMERVAAVAAEKKCARVAQQRGTAVAMLTEIGAHAVEIMEAERLVAIEVEARAKVLAATKRSQCDAPSLPSYSKKRVRGSVEKRVCPTGFCTAAMAWCCECT